MVLNIGPEATSKAKCFFSQTLLPQYIDSTQPPTKRRPFSTIHTQKFNHTLNIIVPAAESEKVKQEIARSAGGVLRYAKVHLKLIDVLSGDFFNGYIKTGNILLLSEPPSTGLEGASFSLAEGVLKIELDKPLYERTGLQGTPIESANRKHVKSRYLISLDLRAPGMVKGKKGFERVRWAAENVFTDALTWLFYDLRKPDNQDEGPVKQFQPFVRKRGCEASAMDRVLVPWFEGVPLGDTDGEKVVAEELLEWLSLVCLDSPRVRANDRIDGFLSRYRVPMLGEEEPKTQDLVRLSWHGFMPSAWVAEVFMAACKASSEGWFGFQIVGFEGKGLVVLKEGKTALTWECEG